MRDSLRQAIESGWVVPLGEQRIRLWGAELVGHAYQAGEIVHVEVQCEGQTFTLPFGDGERHATMNGALEIAMSVETFELIAARVKGLGAKILAAANAIARRPPMLAR